MLNSHIFLDCDGVLIDSAYEAYTVMCLNVGSKPKPLDSKDYSLFQQLRPSVTHAWHYRYVWNFISNPHDPVVFSIPKKPSEIDIKYQNNFRTTRTLFKNDCYQDWLKLHSPFPFLKSISNLMNKDIFTILTTKDASSVKSLLGHFVQWENLRIIDSRDTLSVSKGEIINKLVFQNVQSLFIDDSMQNLESAKDIDNIQLVWATWGYVEKAFKLDNTDTALKAVLSFLVRE
jgi:hypothetical protein